MKSGGGLSKTGGGESVTGGGFNCGGFLAALHEKLGGYIRVRAITSKTIVDEPNRSAKITGQEKEEQAEVHQTRLGEPTRRIFQLNRQRNQVY